MDSLEFRKLIKRREDWYRSTLENDFDFTPILSGLYSDLSHFVYEILQNAEDAKAKSITFDLFPDKLEITHNGTPFTFKDVESITSIGRSTKTEDITAIGKFGVGFKSVYAITQSPTIRSGNFNFTIKNFVVPTIKEDGKPYQHTNILLPFDHQSKSPDQTYALVKNRLENLGLLTLLFLNHVEEVLWNEGGNRGKYIRSAGPEYKGFRNLCRVKVQSSSSVEEYLVFERPITIEKKELKVEIAYKLRIDQNKKERIVHSIISKLFVFLPTNEETYLKFLVQGPFRTTPARDNIPFDDEKNKSLIQEISTLVGDSLPIVRDLGLLDINFLNILPIKDLSVSKQEIYQAASMAVADKFKSNEPLIPSIRNNHCRVSEALLARGKSLTQLLDSSDTSTLFMRTEWIDPDVTEARAPEIRDFLLAKLNVPEIDFEAFAKNLTAEFLKAKDVFWFKEFYKLLKDQKNLWKSGTSRQLAGVIRTKPIIRLEDGEQIEPFDSSDNPQVYLPAPAKRKTHFKTVHKEIVADEEALSFLKELGVKEPDLYAEISEYIIPKYQSGQVIPESGEYFEDFLNLMIGFQEVRSDKKREFIDSLQNSPFIISTKPDSPKAILARPIDVYLLTPENQEYFSGYNNVFFVSEELYDKFEKKEICDFLGELGVATLPRRIQLTIELSWEEKSAIIGSSGHTRDEYTHDHDIHGLEHFLSNVNEERSLLLWNILLKHIEGLSSWQAEDFFKGKYSWYYRRSTYSRDFEAKFTRRLRDVSWLFDQSGLINRPTSLSPSQLSSDYDCKSSTSHILIQHLHFKPDIQQQLLEQLPISERESFEAFLAIPPEERKQVLLYYEEKKGLKKAQVPETVGWEPEVNPEEADISKPEKSF